MTVAIQVENVSKCFRINQLEGAARLKYRTLRESLMEAIASPIRNLRSGAALGLVEDFWALRDIHFTVAEGDVLGMIGRNGAGKSTLLKILTRITEPTTGRAILRGRVGSLLEVGTGFHPELSGRDNVFLNGSILGMRHKEIKTKFDEIVDFSGIEKFIETPVKRYSSGMKVRLAFAVAAHLDLEVMLIDEVLAVGDAEFQRKCLGKMGDVARSGRTIIFVSHNMAAVQNLCNRVLVLRDGKTDFEGPPDRAIYEYLKQFEPESEGNGLISVKRETGLHPIICGIELFDELKNRASAVPTCSPLTVKIQYQHTEDIPDPRFSLVFENAAGVRIFSLQSRRQRGALPRLPAQGTVTCQILDLPLLPGLYNISAGCGSENKQLDRVSRACQLTVTEKDVFGTGKLPGTAGGLVVVKADWHVDGESS